MKHSLSLSFLFLICFVTGELYGQGEVQKSPVPEDAAQKRAATLIGELFKADYEASKSPEQRSELAKKMLKVGRDSKDDVIGRYVLLRIARDVAADAGDITTAMSATELLGTHYQTDVLEMNAEVLAKVVKILRLPKDHQELGSRLQQAVRDAIAQDRFDIAKRINAIALDSARQARSAELVKGVVANGKEIELLESEFQKVQAALATLKTSPTDPEANLLVGQYQCFVKRDWDNGLLMLALGSDEKLKKLATGELSEERKPLDLGNAWWDYSEGVEGKAKAAARLRAAMWYKLAQPGLDGLSKKLVESRLEEASAIEKVEGPPVTPSFIGERAGDERNDNSLGIKLVWCPPGEFTMGSSPKELGSKSAETQSRIMIKNGFWLGKYELTQAQWSQLAKSNPWRGSMREGPNLPVTDIPWIAGMQFCKELTERERRKENLPKDWEYTLPSEAQWEYACRANTTTAFHFGNDELALGDYAWYEGNSDGVPHEVGGKKANEWGLHDMHGNVWEFCRDVHRSALKGRNNVMCRGGAFDAGARSCRSANLNWTSPERFKLSITGFRVALVPLGD